MRWSFTTFYKDIWPASDYEGNSWPKGSINWKKANELLADGYTGILFAIQGDLEYLSYSLGLPRWNRLDRPYTICKATGGSHEYIWLDFRPDAAWTNFFYGIQSNGQIQNLQADCLSSRYLAFPANRCHMTTCTASSPIAFHIFFMSFFC